MDGLSEAERNVVLMGLMTQEEVVSLRAFEASRASTVRPAQSAVAAASTARPAQSAAAAASTARPGDDVDYEDLKRAYIRALNALIGNAPSSCIQDIRSLIQSVTNDEYNDNTNALAQHIMGSYFKAKANMILFNAAIASSCPTYTGIPSVAVVHITLRKMRDISGSKRPRMGTEGVAGIDERMATLRL